MKGKIATPILNVRLVPAGKIVGRIGLNEVVRITDRNDEWLEIEYEGMKRYVMKEYVFERGDPVKRGRINIDKLNVRNRPSTGSSDIVGAFKFGDRVNILEEYTDWLKVIYQDNIAYVAKKFVDFDSAFRDEVRFFTAERAANGDRIIKRGKVNVRSVLRVRKKPGKDIIGEVKAGTIVNILDEKDDWYCIEFANDKGYVAAKYVDVFKGYIRDKVRVFDRAHINGKRIGKLREDDIVYILENKDGWVKFLAKKNKYGYLPTTDLTSSDGKIIGDFLYLSKDFREMPLEPRRKLKESGSRATIATIRIWNKYGNMIDALSRELNIDPAAALAVFQVESGGDGFRKGKLIIRFENHLFYSYWGKYNEDVYHDHFKFDSRVRMRGHYFRARNRDDWVAQHTRGSQSLEWKVLEFAMKLDKTAALKSMSMGAPQILGSNHKIIGYPSVDSMFEHFKKDIRFHILGFFDFCKANPVRIKAMKKKDFITFALYYNGSGQERRYGAIIRRYYEAFKDA